LEGVYVYDPDSFWLLDNSTYKFHYTVLVKFESHYDLQALVHYASLVVVLVDEVSAEAVEVSATFASVFVSVASVLAGGFFPA
jgi:hypothetical protein